MDREQPDENKEGLSDGAQPMLEFIWGQYRTWASTSRRLKKVLSRWKTRVFVLVMLGALAGVLSEQVSNWGAGSMLVQIVGAVSGLSVALASYAGSEILTQQSEQYWLRSRAAAESFKREAYLFLLKAPPYHSGDPGPRVLARIEELMTQMADVPSVSISREDALKRLPDTALSIEAYVEQRVTDQVYQYYRPKADEYMAVLARGKVAGWVLGFAGIILGTAAANGIPGTSVWIAFLSATSASIASFLSTNRYEYLAMSYQAAANRLLMLSAQFAQVDKDDVVAQLHFVAEVEATIALENSAWMVEQSKSGDKESNDQAPPAPREAVAEKTVGEPVKATAEESPEVKPPEDEPESGGVEEPIPFFEETDLPAHYQKPLGDQPTLSVSPDDDEPTYADGSDDQVRSA